MSRTLPKIALDILSDIERTESKLLSWGMVDGFFTSDEIEELAYDRLFPALQEDASNVPYGSAHEILSTLKEHHLLFELPGVERGRFRSRTAEALRLFFRLRQLFPGHLREGGWRSAANLVADYRFLLRPRVYPKRHTPPSTVEASLAAAGAGDRLSRVVLNALLHADTSNSRNLADFQAEAAIRILGETNTKKSRSGTIVCAGTGSGKTLAFYLPALLMLAKLSSTERWTRCLALYPRNELLKDQLSTALREILDLNQVLSAQGRQRVSLGALFGAVPRRADDNTRISKDWPRANCGGVAGRACPYLRCPSAGCQHSSLVWLDSDRKAGIERLHCNREGCDFVLDSNDFVLTRQSMIERPPDLLFSSLEMVNQNMSSAPMRLLLGIGQSSPNRRPRLILLDEVHTYSGMYGAQAALLLRRWKCATKALPHFVGLSATLEDARHFFADLIGEPDSRVEVIAPRAEDLEQEGQEVLLALRGDPVSNTQLLSASIQSAMLLRRILDPIGTPNPLYGTKVFAFTDDLDVTNRLYHTILDAEGWVRPNQTPLASLRNSVRPDYDARFVAGQSWDLVEEIGHDLSDQGRVNVGRTSSQDAGVDQQAEIVVATASLEVGYDDADVGAILQHKAPRDSASFLQRKGRAGRPRGTRPWTVVVLSDYGQDRLAYQGYEQLFSPQLRPRYLPVRNRYVLRIQAVYALMDWLTTQLIAKWGDTKAYLWPTFSSPPGDIHRQYNEERLDHVVEIVEDVLAGGELAKDLHRYLQESLAVQKQIVEQILWEPPRSLMLSVLPTISRRLRRRWSVAAPLGEPTQLEPFSFWSPLPEFVPSNLFSDLNLPEVFIRLPNEQTGEGRPMPILQALREFAPGRVSRRFGVANRNISHWIPISDEMPDRCVVDEFCEGTDELGRFRWEEEGTTRTTPCMRPRALRVSNVPPDIRTSSNARLNWATQFLPRVEPTVSELPYGTPWLSFIRSVGFFTHGYGNAIEVRRFALGSTYDIKRQRDEPLTGTLTFVQRQADSTRPVALGYEIDVDALRLEITFPIELYQVVSHSPQLVRALRTARFVHEIQADDNLNEFANPFERGWLIQIYLSALLLEAVDSGSTLERAAERLFDQRSAVPMESVLDVIFQTLPEDEENDIPTDRRQNLLRMLRDNEVLEALRRAVPALWSEPSYEWEPWLRQRFLSTLGAAVLDACQQACPEVDSGDLCLDIFPGPRGAEEGCRHADGEEIWITETSPGGSGVIEAVSLAYTSDPRRFFHLVEVALAPSDFEEIDVELGTLVDWLNPDSPSYRVELADAVQNVRNARSHRDLTDRNDELRQKLEMAGLAVTHPVMVAMHARVLRPGSSTATDSLLAKMLTQWRQFEEILGVEVDGRVVAYTMSANTDLDNALEDVSVAPIGAERHVWRYSTLYSLLWPRGAAVRSQMLSSYNQFAPLPPTDRWLVLTALPPTTPEIQLERDDWFEDLRNALINEGAAILSAPPTMRVELRASILQVLVHELDTDLLLVHPALVGVCQEGRRMCARFEIREVF